MATGRAVTFSMPVKRGHGGTRLGAGRPRQHKEGDDGLVKVHIKKSDHEEWKALKAKANIETDPKFCSYLLNLAKRELLNRLAIEIYYNFSVMAYFISIPCNDESHHLAGVEQSNQEIHNLDTG